MHGPQRIIIKLEDYFINASTYAYNLEVYSYGKQHAYG